MFGRDYLELMALPKLHPAVQYFSPVALKDGSFAIGADQANGVALVFG